MLVGSVPPLLLAYYYPEVPSAGALSRSSSGREGLDVQLDCLLSLCERWRSVGMMSYGKVM